LGKQVVAVVRRKRAQNSGKELNCEKEKQHRLNLTLILLYTFERKIVLAMLQLYEHI